MPDLKPDAEHTATVRLIIDKSRASLGSVSGVPFKAQDAADGAHTLTIPRRPVADLLARLRAGRSLQVIDDAGVPWVGAAPKVEDDTVTLTARRG